MDKQHLFECILTVTFESNGFHNLLKDCRVLWFCGCKTNTDHHPSTTVLHSWHEVFVHICTMSRYLHFRLVWPKKVVPEVLLYEMQLQLQEEKALFPSTQDTLTQSFTICNVMNFNVCRFIHLLELIWPWHITGPQMKQASMHNFQSPVN